jgi:hypothetical protein
LCATIFGLKRKRQKPQGKINQKGFNYAQKMETGGEERKKFAIKHFNDTKACRRQDFFFCVD